MMKYLFWLPLIAVIILLQKGSSDGNQCKDKAYDWIIIFDESSSISADNFTSQKHFAKSLASVLSIGQDQHLMGAMSYNGQGKVHFYLNKDSDAAGIEAAIMNIAQAGGRTDIALALKFADTTMLQEQRGDRPDVGDIIVLITDGVPTIDTDMGENVTYFDNDIGENITIIDTDKEENGTIIDTDMEENGTIIDNDIGENINTIDNDIGENITTIDTDTMMLQVPRGDRPDVADIIVLETEGIPTIDIDNEESVTNIDNDIRKKITTIDNDMEENVTTTETDIGENKTTIYLDMKENVTIIDNGMGENTTTIDADIDKNVIASLEQTGVIIIPIGVGPYINRNFLDAIATDQDLTISVKSFSELEYAIPIITNHVCSEE